MSAGIVEVPVRSRTDRELALLTCLLSLTPGTLPLHVDTARSVLYVQAARRLAAALPGGGAPDGGPHAAGDAMTGIDAALLALGVALLGALVRVAVGPTRTDRALAADLSFFVLVGATALLAVRQRVAAFVDVALVATLVGFLASLAMALAVFRRRP